jgi:hypothetical protein
VVVAAIIGGAGGLVLALLVVFGVPDHDIARWSRRRRP